MISLTHITVDNFKNLRRADLDFARRGTFLIEGANEAGKSSLFEAIYFGIFGEPLVTEDNRGCLDDLISYGQNAASVEVGLMVRGRRMNIERRLTRERPSRVRAIIEPERDNEPRQEITSVSAARLRIAEELGLDGQAFLNSVFVEQKKLDRLEGLSAAERRKALLSLLNLEGLIELEEMGRFRRQELEEVERKRAVLKRAGLYGEIDLLESRMKILEEEMSLLQVGLKQKAAVEIQARLSQMEREIAALSAAREEAVAARAEAAGIGQRLEQLQAEAGKRWSSYSWPALAALLLAYAAWLQTGRAGAILVALITLSAAMLLRRRYAGGGGHAQETADLRFRLERLEAEADGLSGLEAELVERKSGQRYYLDRMEELQKGIDGPPPDSGDHEAACRYRETARLYQEQMRLLEQKRGALSGLSVPGSEWQGDLHQAETELSGLEHNLRLRERTAELAVRTRERLVRRILPATTAYMRRLLPQLTSNRYHDVEIGDDYRIRVWDERAGSWRTKNVFSGGTRDQFSLALRLAFALATLPQERGTAPSFIFLDEPLSSFDRHRTEALIRLITTGEVARAFDQIFIISHNRDLPAEAFDYHLKVEDGRIFDARRNIPEISA